MVPDPNQPGVPAEGRFVERERRLLRTMTALATARVAAEEEMAAGYAAAASAAEDEHGTARTELAERHRADLRAAADEHAAERQRLKTEARTEYRATQRAQVDDRDRIVEMAGQNEEEARRKLEEAVWVAETVYEAAEDKPEEQFRTREQVIEARRSELLSLHERARELLRKCRQRIPVPETDAADDHGNADADALLDEGCETARAELVRLSRLRVPRLFRGYVMPFLVLLVLGAAGAGAAWWQQWQINQWLAIVVGGALVVSLVGAALLYSYARRRMSAIYARLARAVAGGLAAADAALGEAERERDRQEAALLEERERETRTARETYEPIITEIGQRRERHLERIADTYPRRLAAIERRCETDLREADERYAELRRSINEKYEADLAATDQRHGDAIAARDAARDEAWTRLERAWLEGMERCASEIAAIEAEDAALFPPWDDPAWARWEPPTRFAPSVRLGRITVDRAAVPGGTTDDPRLATPVPARFDLPVTLDFPGACSLLLEMDGGGREDAVNALQTVMFRLLTALPPGKVRFTIIDPVGLGRSFAGFMHLADYDESFVNGRIWTDTRHIEQRLADLTEHMETVIQKYLRNEFETIAEYNEQAGEIAEPYRFLVIADFPSNFSDTAARRLASIISSGARCGVFTLIAADLRQPLPREIALDELERHSVTLVHESGAFRWKDEDFAPLPLELDAPPAEEFLTERLHVVGAAAKDATRVEVPFRVVAPAPDEEWTRDCTRALTVPLGRSGATKLQELELGPGTSQHLLMAGKTGSGKSTLLHVLITNLALWYSPDEVQFYLVDFKKGVEFKTYAVHDLPHARAVAVESDREFGLSVLQRLDVELRERGDRFRMLGVQDLAGYRRLDGVPPMPRTLLIVDEFQELFVEDDKIGQEAALLLDRLVRQGRAFGIHVLLGSQTLGGAYTLARSTMGQMQVRIALQCSEADSYMIMSDDNAAARLLGRPGEAIYNDAGGAVEANSPFQIVWLADEQRERELRRVERRAAASGYRRPDPLIVFEGNASADLAGNHLLEALLDGREPEREPDAPAPAPRAWLGEAIAIKPPTAAVFRRQSGSNLLIVGQQDEPALAMCASTLVSLAAQLATTNGSAPRFYVLDGSPADALHAGYLERVGAALPVDVYNVPWREVDAAMSELAEELERRREGDRTDAPPCFLVIHGLQRFRMLRSADDFSFSMDDADKPPAPDRQFAEILREGAPYGIHTIAWCDTATNLTRTLDRTGLREFEMRVLFQMSGADSTQLIDSPAAGKLGLRRAVFHVEEEGVLEKFRPYALPEESWLAAIAERFARRAGATG